MPRMDRIGTLHTTVKTVEGKTIVTYHSTEVVVFDHDKIVLNSGGWLTNTTKNRMNQTSRQFELGFSVFQKDYEWFVSIKGYNKDVPFKDGMEISRGSIRAVQKAVMA